LVLVEKERLLLLQVAMIHQFLALDLLPLQEQEAAEALFLLVEVTVVFTVLLVAQVVAVIQFTKTRSVHLKEAQALLDKDLQEPMQFSVLSQTLGRAAVVVRVALPQRKTVVQAHLLIHLGYLQLELE
jgi:hypothetical protein